MAGFFDKVTGLYDQALQQLQSEYGTPGTPEYSKKVMNMALDFAPLGITAYHGTLSGALDGWKPGTHFGTAKAAMERMLVKAGLSSKDAALVSSNPKMFKRVWEKMNKSGAAIYPVDIADDAKRLVVSDDSVNNLVGVVDRALEKGILRKADKNRIYKAFMSGGPKVGESVLFDTLKSKGIDVLEYINEIEDAGSVSYQVINPEKIRGFFTK